EHAHSIGNEPGGVRHRDFVSEYLPAPIHTPILSRIASQFTRIRLWHIDIHFPRPQSGPVVVPTLINLDISPGRPGVIGFGLASGG
ncbi:hypothetical protein, partial [Nocardia tengchongensis]